MRSYLTQQPHKVILRRQMLEKRGVMPNALVVEKSEFVCRNFLKISGILDKSIYSIYLSTNNEVNTKKIISVLIALEKEIILPAFIQDKWVLARYLKSDNLEIGPFGVLQPVKKVVFDPTKVEVSIFPGVAFDIFGNRLGYGLGIFDQLFHNTDAVKIGLCFEKQIADAIPGNSKDIKMNFIVTDERIINCTA